MYYIAMSVAITIFALRQMPLAVEYDDPKIYECMHKVSQLCPSLITNILHEVLL